MKSSRTYFFIFCLLLTSLCIVGCQSDGEGDVNSDSNTITCADNQILEGGRCIAVLAGATNCLDRDKDGHTSLFCGGTDVNDMNSSVNPSMSEVCGDGFDNDQDGLTDKADSADCPSAPSPLTYYVDPVSGNDATGDGSVSAPFRTIAHVNTLVGSGDTVLLYSGNHGDLILVQTSNPYGHIDDLENLPPFYTDWVTYKAAPGHEHAAIVGGVRIGTRLVPNGYHDKYPKNSEQAYSGPHNPTLRNFYIAIEGLTVEDGIEINSGKFVKIKNNIVRRLDPISDAVDCNVFTENTGITYHRSQYLQIEGNEVTHTGHGIHGSGHDVVIKNNDIHGITHDGLGMYLGSNFLIEGNTVHDTDDGYNDNQGTTCNIHSDGFQPYIVSYVGGADKFYSINNVSFKRNKLYHMESLGIMMQTSPYRNPSAAMTSDPSWGEWMREIGFSNWLFENNIFGSAAGFTVNILTDYFDGLIIRHNSILRTETDSYVSHLGRTILTDSVDVRVGGSNSTHAYVYNNVFSTFVAVPTAYSFGGYNYHDVSEMSWYSAFDYYRDTDLFKIGSTDYYDKVNFSAAPVVGSALIDAGLAPDSADFPMEVPISGDFNGTNRDSLPDIGAIEIVP